MRADLADAGVRGEQRDRRRVAGPPRGEIDVPAVPAEPAVVPLAERGARGERQRLRPAPHGRGAHAADPPGPLLPRDDAHHARDEGDLVHVTVRVPRRGGRAPRPRARDLCPDLIRELTRADPLGYEPAHELAQAREATIHLDEAADLRARAG